MEDKIKGRIPKEILSTTIPFDTGARILGRITLKELLLATENERLASYKKKLSEEVEEFMDKQIGDANSRDAYGGTGKETAKIIKDDLKQFINLTK